MFIKRTATQQPYCLNKLDFVFSIGLAKRVLGLQSHTCREHHRPTSNERLNLFRHSLLIP